MKKVGIASSSQLAADAGAAIADIGGNAVDAAVAAVFVSMCTDIGVVAPGCGGFLTIWPDGDDPIVIDAYAEMPGRGLPPERFGRGGLEIWMEYGGGLKTIVGPGSVAVPGAIAGLGIAIERYGSMPWREVLMPAITAVRNGFPLLGAAAEYMAYAHDTIYGWQPESAEIVQRDDKSPIRSGDIVHLPELADTLSVLAEEGPRFLYGGDLGRAITSAVQDGEGLLTMTDLREYSPVIRDPVEVKINGWTIATNPPPAVGGTCMAAMLLLASSEEYTRWNAETLRRLVEIQRAVLEYRSHRLDPNDGERSAEAVLLLEAAAMADLDRIITAPSTVHTSTVDSEGTGCSITVSAGYGSGMMAPGTGFWLNNSLGETELHHEGFHGLPAGTRLVSNMAPTVARSVSGNVLSIGSPGADRITTAISSVLLNLLHLQMPLVDAVNYPRLHTEIFDGVPTVALEPGLSLEEISDLEIRRFLDTSMYFGGVQAALWNPESGHSEVADPRREGGTALGGL